MTHLTILYQQCHFPHLFISDLDKSHVVNEIIFLFCVRRPLAYIHVQQFTSFINPETKQQQHQNKK